MRRAGPRPTCGAGLRRLEILWEPGEGFEIAFKTAQKLQPRTLITYFPALPYWADDRARKPARASSSII